MEEKLCISGLLLDLIVLHDTLKRSKAILLQNKTKLIDENIS